MFYYAFYFSLYCYEFILFVIFLEYYDIWWCRTVGRKKIHLKHLRWPQNILSLRELATVCDDNEETCYQNGNHDIPVSNKAAYIEMSSRSRVDNKIVLMRIMKFKWWCTLPELRLVRGQDPCDEMCSTPIPRMIFL